MNRPSGTRRRRWVRPLISAGIVVVLVCCCGGAFSEFFIDGQSKRNSAYAGSCGEGLTTINPDAKLPHVSDLNEEQVRNAAIIIQVGQTMNVPPRGWVIAVATASRESSLQNLPNLGARNDHDSLGLFQQRPSMGWGSEAEILNPEYASKKFYEKLLKVPGWETMALTNAAQAVQASAFPDAYRDHEPLATTLVNELANGAALAVGNLTNLRCANAGEIAASGWTAPIKAKVTGGFHEGRTHYGIDFAADKGTPIFAAAAGTVAEVLCNAGNGNCNIDGGTNVSGCGWYVDIDHADGVMTRYCHMLERPRVSIGEQVAPGQQIGIVGSSGNSSGAHLHFEVHTGGGTGNESAVNPVDFMRQVGAPLDVK